jgi:hypothetical protein
VDVERAAELYAQGWTLSQIGAELGVRSNVVHDHLRRAGVTMRPIGAPTHPAFTQEILDLREQGLTWTEVAERVDMTVFRGMESLPERPATKAAAAGQMAAGFRRGA